MNKIRKKDLIHGAYYKGRSRNASEARWDGDRNVFVHWRYKFGETFLDELRHPEDEQVYDVFVAYEKIDTPTKPIPL